MVPASTNLPWGALYDGNLREKEGYSCRPENARLGSRPQISEPTITLIPRVGTGRMQDIRLLTQFEKQIHPFEGSKGLILKHIAHYRNLSHSPYTFFKHAGKQIWGSLSLKSNGRASGKTTLKLIKASPKQNLCISLRWCTNGLNPRYT